MSRRAVRRGQLIAPFGPGAMVVARDGTSLIVAGLDHWFERESRDTANIDRNEFRVQEWRLEQSHELDVDFFCLPPDIRRRRRDFWVESPTNMGLTIPALRFPRWHVCVKCHSLDEFPLVQRERPRCRWCGAESEAEQSSGRKVPPPMVQVRFIAICDQGHVQDFPWREWVHQELNPTCTKRMKLRATGGASLAATMVECGCGAKRSLERITEADPPTGGSGSSEDGDGSRGREPSTFLTDNLAPGQRYLCPGHRPWLGEDEGAGCVRPIRGSLRGATNVYYSLTRSAIYLPRASDEAPQQLIELLEGPQVAPFLALLRAAKQPANAAALRASPLSPQLRDFTDRQLTAALQVINSSCTGEHVPVVPTDDSETAFRRAEYVTLRTGHTERQLITRTVSRSEYQSDVGRFFGKFTLVEKLRETRVFTGFARVYPDKVMNTIDRNGQLWRRAPERPNRWLPAYIVYGEGIYLEFDPRLLKEWEVRPEVVGRVDVLNSHYQTVQINRRLRQRFITPRLVLLHTFSHLLMNQLTFECGYGSASLRERLYVSTTQDVEMAGVLIYTAAGDAEGTLGGLVRMGKPGNLEPVIRRALTKAEWCSADPVCMELGERGQGPDSCNLAACHNCALVPETSCEEFNRFLDRGLVIGTLECRGLGFFQDLE